MNKNPVGQSHDSDLRLSQHATSGSTHRSGTWEALIDSGDDRPMEKASDKAQIRSNRGLLREFATLQDVFFHGRDRPHELISASLAGASFFLFPELAINHRGVGVAGMVFASKFKD